MPPAGGRRRRRSNVRTTAATVVGGVVLAGCGAGVPGAATGDLATWELADPRVVTAETRSLDVRVTRAGCSGGITGQVLEPRVQYEDGRVVVTTEVEPLGDGTWACPSNDAVTVRVELDEPLRDRDLVDGACLAAESGSVRLCEDAVRWRP
ncbi:hypothetical protein [Georgenia satyanarayanai]|uniref:hypothetical protein n=1 Tax=Georgenia satyanarayanai TaxID=860221 RepID=UPI001264BD36|nr:hypothetical protein [Georgenia satyanarayanai]